MNWDWMWVVTVASLIGTVANVYRRRWGFLVWVGTNSAWVVYDIHLAAWPQAALMAVCLVLAVWGWFAWGRASSSGRGDDAARSGSAYRQVEAEQFFVWDKEYGLESVQDVRVASELYQSKVAAE